jgi:serine/threonine protein kinase
MLALESGSTLGRYTLLLPVGQGGQASVWAACFVGLAGFEKTVAIKTLLPPRDDEDAHIERFTDEALLATRLRHPNVVEVLDFGEEDGVLYIVMPWIDGEPVNAIIEVAAKRGGIPLPIAVNLIGQVCRGLHAAHELGSEQGEPLGLVHRDVSPENILVTREGTAKLADFGVATACGQLGQVTGDTDLGRARGKVWYMAPEELWGEPVDRRADLFALGVVLYRMTTGRHPFASEGGRESVRRLLAGAEAVPPRTFLPNYPEALEASLMRALSESPEERPRTALELRQSLFRAIAPASDDDVASFLDELFSGRRLERDERLRVARHSRPEPVASKPAPSGEKPAGDRSNLREMPHFLGLPLRTRTLGFSLFIGLAAALAVASGTFVRERAIEKLPRSEVKPTVAATATIGVAPSPPPVAPVTRRELAAANQRRSIDGETLGGKTPRAERRSVDVSPVREVGF